MSKNSFVFNSVIWNANHPYFNTKFQIMLINELKRYFFQGFVWIFFFFWNPTKFIISILYLCWVRMTKNRVKHFAHFFWRSSFFLWEQKTYHDFFRAIERLRVWEKFQIFSPLWPPISFKSIKFKSLPTPLTAPIVRQNSRKKIRKNFGF